MGGWFGLNKQANIKPDKERKRERANMSLDFRKFSEGPCENISQDSCRKQLKFFINPIRRALFLHRVQKKRWKERELHSFHHDGQSMIMITVVESL